MAIAAGDLTVQQTTTAVKPTFSYRDPTGIVWDLSDTDPDTGYFTPWGIKGWGATTYEVTTDKIPRGGVNIRATHANEARLTWPLHIYGSTHTEWLQRHRALKQAFAMTVQRNQTGTITVTRQDGTSRQIDVIYESGFEGEGNFDDWVSSNPVLTLMCPDGYWRDTAPLVTPRTFQPGGSFLSPLWTVSSAEILGDSIVENPGDVTAWPQWTITGPAATISATNHTTGQSWTLTHAIAAGELIIITTQRPTVRGPDGSSIIADLNWPDAYLWGLLPGMNEVTFTVSGSATGTAIELRYYPRYEGA